MKSFENSITLQNVDKIKAICGPLFANRVKHFTHDITFTNGQLSELTTEPGVYETWSHKRASAVFVNDGGRILDSGIYLNDVLMGQDEYYKNALDIFFPIIGCNKLLEIVEREEDCQHMYHIGVHYDGNDYPQWLLNNIDFFKKFISHYKRTAKHLISEVKNSEHRIILPIRPEYNSMQPSFNLANEKNSLDYEEEEKAVSLIHCYTQETITFAKQQSICLRYLAQGKSAKEIALNMGLSFRTVEHYLEAIRKKLGCSSNMELVAKYCDQINLVNRSVS